MWYSRARLSLTFSLAVYEVVQELFSCSSCSVPIVCTVRFNDIRNLYGGSRANWRSVPPSISEFSASYLGEFAYRSLYGLQGQNWCSLGANCNIQNGTQCIGAWALPNGSLGNLAFGISNLDNNTYSLVAWYKDSYNPQAYQIDHPPWPEQPSSGWCGS